MAISPWLPRGQVFQEPQAPFDTHGNGRSPFSSSQFELSSIPATVKHLFNLTTFLTGRDAWAGNVEELLTEVQPREDCPLHFPDAPDPAAPWPHWPTMADIMAGRGAGTRRLQGNSSSSAGVRDQGGNGTHSEDGAPKPHHCPMQKRVCPGTNAVSVKQRKQIRLYSRLTNTPEPNIDSMVFGEAAAWLGGLWHAWDAQGGPLK